MRDEGNISEALIFNLRVSSALDIIRDMVNSDYSLAYATQFLNLFNRSLSRARAISMVKPYIQMIEESMDDLGEFVEQYIEYRLLEVPQEEQKYRYKNEEFMMEFNEGLYHFIKRINALRKEKENGKN